MPIHRSEIYDDQAGLLKSVMYQKINEEGKAVSADEIPDETSEGRSETLPPFADTTIGDSLGLDASAVNKFASNLVNPAFPLDRRMLYLNDALNRLSFSSGRANHQAELLSYMLGSIPDDLAQIDKDPHIADGANGQTTANFGVVKAAVIEEFLGLDKTGDSLLGFAKKLAKLPKEPRIESLRDILSKFENSPKRALYQAAFLRAVVSAIPSIPMEDASTSMNLRHINAETKAAAITSLEAAE